VPVRRLQNRMTLAEFDTGGVDGRFDTKTEKAVKELQEQAALDVDGIVGPATWEVVDTFENEGDAR
jgi:peptidoglycan hydrolase-like protein with peptidoglycan-binding domain